MYHHPTVWNAYLTKSDPYDEIKVMRVHELSKHFLKNDNNSNFSRKKETVEAVELPSKSFSVL